MLRLFVHLPKCAGTSVRSVVENALDQTGENPVLVLDYDSHFKIPGSQRVARILRDLSDPVEVSIDALVYGHFFPIKYIGAQKPHDLRLVTILRDPLDRLISHFNFWNNGDFSDHYLWRKMKYHRWTVEDFILCDEMRNFYSQYFSLTPLQFFSYIGIYEDLDRSVNNCLLALGIDADPVSTPHLNITEVKHSRDLSSRFVALAMEIHAQDYLVYEYARLKFHSGI